MKYLRRFLAIFAKKTFFYQGKETAKAKDLCHLNLVLFERANFKGKVNLVLFERANFKGKV
jgi:hypothetical protein